MSESAETIVLKWAWRHHSLTVDRFDSLEKALRAAVWAADDGEEAFDAVEVIAGGVSMIYDEKSPEYKAERHRQFEEDMQRIRSRPPITALVQVERDGKWATIDNAHSMFEAEGMAATLRPALGQRVRTIPYRA